MTWSSRHIGIKKWLLYFALLLISLGNLTDGVVTRKVLARSTIGRITGGTLIKGADNAESVRLYAAGCGH